MLETEDCCSRLQLAEHPSPLTVFPSSHSSLPTENQSPQIVLQTLMSLVQTLPPAHVHPFSTTQSGEHPSPLTVFPSSHCASYLIIPSPQTGGSYRRTSMHSEQSIVQRYKGAHPLSPSHVSNSSFFPLPQATTAGELLHVHPSSTTHVWEHPSPLTVFPSSQDSKLSIKPLPQTWTSQFRCASCRHCFPSLNTPLSR